MKGGGRGGGVGKRSGLEYRMNFKKMRRRKKIMMIIMKMNYKNEKEEQKVEDLLGSGTFIQRNKTGSHTTPNNEMHNFPDLYLIFYLLLSATCFEPSWFILRERETVVYAVWCVVHA